MLSIIDGITEAFLSAIATGGQSLVQYMLPILTVCAMISWYREYALTVMSSGAGFGDALAHALTVLLGSGLYLVFLTHLFPLAQGALDTVFLWALQGSGNTVTVASLRTPSWILEAGFKSARPIADFSTWWGTAKAVVRLGGSVTDTIAYIVILFSFLMITAHHIFMLVEYHLSIMFGSVLVPWGAWRMTAGMAEFSLGWMTGGLIRALVSTAMIGLATPLFEVLAQPVPSSGFFSMSETWILCCGAGIFCYLCWQIPASAARMAGQASLGITSQSFFAAMGTLARFGMMAAGAGQAAARVISPLVQQRQWAPARS